MKTNKEMMARPDLKVIKRAIQLINSGQQHYSCYALSRALNERSEGLASEALHWRYRTQYRRACLINNRVPNWWNHHCHCKAERVAALRHFANLCKEAAK